MADYLAKKADVLRWIQGNGYQKERTQFYADCKACLITPVKSGPMAGKYRLSDVKRYAQSSCRRIDTGMTETDEDQERRERKDKAITEREEIRREREQFLLEKDKNMYVRREDVESFHVARSVAFMAHLNHTVQTKAGDWIELVHGDVAFKADLIEEISQTIAQRMSDFAADVEIEVLFEANE